jgi:hypothetical protein
VESAESPAPYNGNPPAKAATDCKKVFEQVDLEKESAKTAIEHDFTVERRPGYYFVQVRAILFRVQDGKTFAQVEPFFFRRRPLHIPVESNANVTFPIAWPTQPLSELHRYGTFRSQKCP